MIPDLFFLVRVETAARRAGYLVRRAADAASLLAAARAERPVAVVVDLGAPESRGPFEVFRGLRADPALAAVPTLGFLSHVRSDLARAAREAGCGTVLAKSALSADTPGVLARLVAGGPEAAGSGRGPEEE